MSITSANASVQMTTSVSFPQGVTLDQFAVDDAWATEMVKMAEFAMGVDGHLSKGYVPVAKPLKISLQADSESMPAFDQLCGNQDAAQEVETVDIVIAIPGLAAQFTFHNGGLESGHRLPDAGKVLKKRDFQFQFEGLFYGPLAGAVASAIL
jgi:hypothetical protein